MRHPSQKVCPIAVWNPCVQSLSLKSLKENLDEELKLHRPHRIACYLLLVVNAGSLSVIVDHQAMTVAPQQALLVNPNSICQIAQNNPQLASATDGWFLCFDTEFFALRYHNHKLSDFQIMAGNRGFTHFLFNESQFDHTVQLLSSMHREAIDLKQGGRQVLRSYLNILLFELERIGQQKEKSQGHSLKEEKIRQFEQMMETDFSHKKNLTYYATALFITANYLNKLCNAVRGCSAGELLRRHALIEAKRKLLFTPGTVSEIGYELGFENPSYFISFFKKATGYTPEVFRNKEW